jgi:pyruvate-ferredoxin/flavodoxin oxidoreductase
MACRQTGFAMLCETNPQEVMDLSAVAHLAAIKGRVPFLNFFDGFRTSHEIQKVAVWDYDDLAEMCDMDAVAAFRARALNPERPVMRGSHENGDIFFQHREACNAYYDAVPDIVEEYMGQVNAKLGTNYQLFNYYGAPDADRVIIAMGSICDVAEEVIDYLNAHGEKVGLVKVRLYRPGPHQGAGRAGRAPVPGRDHRPGKRRQNRRLRHRRPLRSGLQGHPPVQRVRRL